MDNIFRFWVLLISNLSLDISRWQVRVFLKDGPSYLRYFFLKYIVLYLPYLIGNRDIFVTVSSRKEVVTYLSSDISWVSIIDI